MLQGARVAVRTDRETHPIHMDREGSSRSARTLWSVPRPSRHSSPRVSERVECAGSRRIVTCQSNEQVMSMSVIHRDTHTLLALANNKYNRQPSICVVSVKAVGSCGVSFYGFNHRQENPPMIKFLSVFDENSRITVPASPCLSSLNDS